MSNKKYNHITDSDRLQIEHMLRNGEPLARIAAKIGRHPSTVAREIRARSVPCDKGAYGRVTNRCAKRRECGRSQICMDKGLKSEKLLFQLSWGRFCHYPRVFIGYRGFRQKKWGKFKR